MKIALALDGLLTDTEQLKKEWFAMLGDYRFLNDASFYAALKPYDDVRAFGDWLLQHKPNVYIFAERQKSMMLPTNGWLRRNMGWSMPKGQLVMQAIKRYDCRLMGIDVFIDSDPATIENLNIETIRPVRNYLVDRQRGETLYKIIEELT